MLYFCHPQSPLYSPFWTSDQDIQQLLKDIALDNSKSFQAQRAQIKIHNFINSIPL